VLFWVVCQILRLSSNPTASRYCVHWLLL
jgi:hypothetical protein